MNSDYMKRVRNNTHRAKKIKFQYPQELTLVDEAFRLDVPMPVEQQADKVWISRKYLVLLYERETPEYPNMKRMSVCRN
ncbi:MAG TPA: hypothetical protein VKE92_08520, partial [Anaerolineales bacterium]|nr:hypothetical protein [Anaerolineales bacterium]